MPSRLVLAPLLAVILLASACGGKPAAHSIASLTTTGTTGTTGTTATTPTPSGDSPSPGGSGGPGQFAMKVQNGAKFAACMRKNGVPNFPDPNSSGTVSIGPSSGIDPSSPKFRAAQGACRKLLPNGGQPTPAQLAKMQAGALAFSKCMRAHGVTNFPDPTVGAGGIGIKIQAGSKSGLEPNNPTFRAAQQACQGHLAFGKGGGTTQSGGK
jgi:hypothetical protein